ncbi:MAG: nicotinate-nucleotide adenylyltransferase [Desulfosalsimonas sp.]
MRTALFGGTFNPVHIAHLRVAEEVREGFDLDRVFFIPAANPPHKQDSEIAPASDRYEMLMRATSGNPAFEVSDLEIKRAGRSYTIDTVRQFAGLLPGGSKCWLVMGMHAFAEIDTRKSYHEIFDRIGVIVLSRPSDAGGGESLTAGIAEVLSGRVSEAYRFDRENARFVHPEKNCVCPFFATSLGISASMIRQKAAEGKSLRYLVSADVEKYIHEKGLYL